MFKKTCLKSFIFFSGWLMASAVYAETMKIGTWLSPKHPQNAVVLPTWGKWIELATDGRVKIQLVYHQGHPKGVFGDVEDGNYDAGWSFHGYFPGKFKLTVIAELPLLGAEPEAASVAHWRIYQKYFKTGKANEHKGLVLAGLFLHGSGEIMMREPVENLAEMKGKKIRVGGGVQGAIAEQLGIKAVPAPGSKVYEILSQGIADGVFMPVGEQKTLRLSEVTSFIYQSPQGMYLGSFSIFISPDFLSKLSQKDREAVMSVSGESLSALAGRIWQKNDAEGYAKARQAGHQIVKWSASDQREFEKIAKEIESDWLKSVESRRVDAKKALAEFRAIARSYQ